MDQEKPFKAIEVIDSRTGQICKIACMSCIRGHRTTSCGIPVCRTKVFWTVKRPGRPSNSCTCRFGSSGRCQCVVAKSSCPHKPKKGEKRSVDCRCDEQGRYCCLLEPEHWDALTAMQNPKVEFFSTREALEARYAPPPPSYPPTPAHSVGTPQTTYSLPNTPGPPSSVQGMSSHSSSYQPVAFSPPQYGMMGLTSPFGQGSPNGQDVLGWNGQGPQPSQDNSLYASFHQPGPMPAINPLPNGLPSSTSYNHIPDYQPQDIYPPTASLEAMSLPNQEPPSSTYTFNLDKAMQDFYNYQFPGAICQNCGLSGCTCKSCPAVMQNSSTGSWAQCCSRKHTRTATVRAVGPAPMLMHQQLQQSNSTTYDMSNATQNYDMTSLQQGQDQLTAQNFNIDDITMQGQDPMDISEFLMTDLERPTHGCCCGSDS